MSKLYEHYTPQEMQTILEEYQPGVRGKRIKALTKRHNVKGGHNLVKYWLSKCGMVPKSLEKLSGGDRRSILTEQEKKKYVDRYVTKKSKKDAVNYVEVKEHIENETGKSPSGPTVRRIGKERGQTSKKVKRALGSEGETLLMFFNHTVFRHPRF
jgi:hypothetical protein